MSLLAYIIIFSVLESLISFSGVVFLLFKSDSIKRFSHFFSSVAIGVLLGVVFYDVLPEALSLKNSNASTQSILSFVLLGIIIFLVVEIIIRWHHHHQDYSKTDSFKPSVYLILFGDLVHNFIDGIIITTSFFVDIRFGIITSIAILIHEIPHELSDFGFLIASGLDNKKAIKYNFYVSLSTIVGALLAYIFLNQLSTFLPYILALVAGNFLYIALSDLVPETHEHSVKTAEVVKHFILMLMGIALIYLM